MSAITPPIRLAVLASGGGSNLQAIIEYFDSPGGERAAQVVLVASDRPGAGALSKALTHQIPAAILENPKDGPGMVKLLESHHVDVISLAGYLRLVPAEVIQRWKGRIVNIHPALLPKFGGKGMYGHRVHEAVIAAGEKQSGATVHHVTAEYDRGFIIAQERVPVESGDTADSLAARVLTVEHHLYPRTIHELARTLTPFTYSRHVPRALLSVSDKSGLVEFASELHKLGWELVSTGGTAKVLRDAGLPCLDVSAVTNFPEMLDGRVKTLHPAVHGGLLARRDLPEHMSAIAAHGISPIDLVCVNLYPFSKTAAKPGVLPADVIEQIDIGGPSMVRSAAKNFASVYVVVDPADYSRVLEALRRGADAIILRRELAAKVYAHTAAYDAAIAAWFAAQRGESFPERITIALERKQSLRYGENPGQLAAFYVEAAGGGLAGITQYGGKELSFNNLLDLEGALLATGQFGKETCCAIVKHTTPCGLATGATAAEAYKKALACDPMSAFGSVIAFTVPVDEDAARAVASLFVECVVAPSFSPEALQLLGEKKNLRVLAGTAGTNPDAMDFKRVRGGMLVQECASAPLDDTNWQVVSKRQPTAAEKSDLLFAWRAVASVKSNAIVLSRDGATIGIGAGQMSRVDAAFVAVHKARAAGHDTKGTVLGSDAFFPFRDGIDQAAEAGVRAIVQPGGSVKDPEVIAAANEHDIAMVFTGRRTFRH